jgi:hypothetical protein
MKQSYLLNIALIVIIAILAWFNFKPVQQDLKIETISSLTSDKVSSINIKKQHGESVYISKTTDTWQLQQPIKARANKARIKLILELLSLPAKRQLASVEQVDLNKFGLASPKLVLAINDQLFKLGDQHPIHKQRYLNYAGKIFLIDDDLYTLLNASATSFIDNRLIAEQQQISKISLPNLHDGKINSESKYTFTYADKQWQTSDSQISKDKMVQVIDAWKKAYAMFVSPVSEVNTTSAKIEIWFNDSATPLILSVEHNEKTIKLTDVKNKLKYQFPAALLHQLFITENNDA